MKLSGKRPALLASLLLLSPAHGYVNGGLPRHKQIAWLKQLTVDICESPPGALSDDMLKQAPKLMEAWAHAPPSRSVQGKDCAIAVETLLKRVIDERRAGNDHAIATTSDYNYMLEGWATSGAGMAAADRCELILTEMQEQFQKDGDLQPNLDSFKNVLLAWKKTSGSNPHAPYRAQRILEWMVRLYQNGDNDMALPDDDCFHLVLQTWSQSGHPDAPQKTEAMLVAMERLHKATQLENLRPTAYSYNNVLSAWAKSDDTNAVARAYSVLQFMEQSVDVEPDMVSYSTVINALARTGDYKNSKLAVTLLRHVEDGYRIGQSSLEPDTILYNCAIGCLSKIKAYGSYRQARSVLDRQIQLYDDGCYACKPDVYGFTSVISTCAMEKKEKKERSKAFSVALATFQQLRRNDKYGAPNHVTYSSMLKCCSRLLVPSDKLRQKWTRLIFEMAAKDGCVSDLVLTRLKEAASPDLYRELLDGLDRTKLPEEWTRNVDEKRYSRKKNRRRAEV